MKIIYREDQSRTLNYILDILKALIEHDDDVTTDAIVATYRIAHIVGGKEMMEKLEVKDEDGNNRSGRWWRHHRDAHSLRKRTRSILRRY